MDSRGLGPQFLSTSMAQPTTFEVKNTTLSVIHAATSIVYEKMTTSLKIPTLQTNNRILNIEAQRNTENWVK